jgi:ubiquitin-conjugating enzyme E2 T
MQRSARMKSELSRLQRDPPPGVSCWPVNDSIDQLQAKLLGAKGSPYESGIFILSITIPERYPFEPPKVRFLTKIYHPNIDSEGRICLDSLKMPPQGAWRPAQNISTVLTSIQLLLSEPNPEDPLMTDIASEYKNNRAMYERTAKEWTKLYASDDNKEN